jgi:hypothetical protein
MLALRVSIQIEQPQGVVCLQRLIDQFPAPRRAMRSFAFMILETAVA